MALWQPGNGVDWQFRAVEACPGSLPKGRQVVVLLDPDTRTGVFQIDLTAPQRVWLTALSNAMTESARGFVYAGDILTPDLASSA